MTTKPRPSSRSTGAAHSGRTPRTTGDKNMAKAATAMKPVEDDRDKNLPAVGGMMDQFDQDAGKGRENVRAVDMSVPFWTVLHKLSPECDKTTGSYVPGAEAGMIMNTVTKELIAGEVGGRWIPCHFEKVVIEWAPRESGGGLVAVHPIDTPLLATARPNEKGQPVKANSINLLIETAQHFVVRVRDDGSTEAGLIAMSSSQLKKSRQWNSMMATVQLTRGDGTKFSPPTFSRSYHLTTTQESNSKGSWFGWKIGDGEFLTDPQHYQVAKSLHEAAIKGEVTARPVRPDDGGETSATPSGSTANKPY
jgi:hypothetical protein